MRFGMPTLIELKSTESCAAVFRELGLGFVELNINLPEYQADKLDATCLFEIAEKYGVYFTIHLDENLNPCDFNNKVAAKKAEASSKNSLISFNRSFSFSILLISTFSLCISAACVIAVAGVCVPLPVSMVPSSAFFIHVFNVLSGIPSSVEAFLLSFI